MLFGQNLGWSHQRGLVAVGQGIDQAHGRDRRLARADFALQ